MDDLDLIWQGERALPTRIGPAAALTAAAPWVARRSSRLRPHSARVFKRRSPGESGGDGDLTGAETEDREAVEAARRSVVDDGCGGARAKRGYGLLG